MDHLTLAQFIGNQEDSGIDNPMYQMYYRSHKILTCGFNTLASIVCMVVGVKLNQAFCYWLPTYYFVGFPCCWLNCFKGLLTLELMTVLTV